jgi:hypothetical protein
VVLIGPCTNYHVKLCSPSTPYTKCHHPARCYTANGHDRNTGDEEHEEQQCFVVKGPAGSRSYRQEAFVAPTIAVCLTVSLSLAGLLAHRWAIRLVRLRTRTHLYGYPVLPLRVNGCIPLGTRELCCIVVAAGARTLPPIVRRTYQVQVVPPDC